MSSDSLIQPILDFIKCGFPPLQRHFSYAFKCDSKLQGLQEQVQQLQNKKERLQQSIVEATSNGEEIFSKVTEWLSAAEKDVREADTIIHRKEDVKNKCLFGLCPNFKTRYQLSKIAEKKSLAIVKLCNQQGFDSVSLETPQQQMVEPSVYIRKALPSRVSILNQVIDALRDPNLDTIGVYGIGGVGKTTLAKEVQAKSLQEKMFEKVAVVDVSQTPLEVRRIQGEIADFLELKFDSEEISGRASLLHKRLKKSRVLIILDNLSEIPDLVAVGISSKVCKIMLTSRNMYLLSRKMGVQKLFSLEALQEVEALSLFMSVAEPNHDFLAIATNIAKKCAGLPLLIKIVAGGLKNEKSQHVWNDTLDQLATYDREDMYVRLFIGIESSYEKLPGEEIKSLFLLCALFGQSNIHIQYLLTYSMGLGLFKHIENIEGARDRVFTLIDGLKANGLLLDGDMVGFVKMHDVVRAIARNIASREQNAFFGTGGFSLRDQPRKDCTRISLQIGGVNELPDMNFPRAELFLLFIEDPCLEIPDSYFTGMKKLKVVDFSGARLVSFPSSIGLLTNLETLCLHRCQLDGVGILGELNQLQFLSLANSDIVELPREIEHLTRLKLLDLRSCSSLEVIPASVLSKLCSLEELYVLNSFVRWNSKGNASLLELDSLSHLSTLEIEIVDPKMIPRGFKCFCQLRRYKISIGSAWDWNGEYERSKTLKLKVEAGVHLEDGIGLLLSETEDLYLDGVRGIENIFNEGFPKLKHLQVENDYDIQYPIKSTRHASCNDFPVLESLYLNKLHSMEKICSSHLGMGSFGELQILKISNCDKLSSPFSFSSIRCLQKLRELEVSSCENVEAIASEDEHQNNEVLELPRLSSLKLKKLPHLTGFCKIKEGSEQFGLLFNSMVCFPNLTSLEVNGCKSLKHIQFAASMVTFSSIKVLNNLVDLKLERCYNCVQLPCLGNLPNLKFMEMNHMGKVKCVDNEFYGFDNASSSNESLRLFPALQTLSVTWMENLTEWSSPTDGKKVVAFPRLQNLSILSCPKLKGFPLSDLSQLVSLEIKECEELKLVIDEQQRFSFLKVLSITGCSKLTHLRNWLQSIQSFDNLSVRKCEWLMFIPYNLQKVSYLTSLEIYCCRRLRYFPEDILSQLTKLQNLSVGGFSEELDDFHYLNRIEDLPCLEELEIWGSDFFGREMNSLPNQLQHLSVLKALKIMGFTAMDALPEWLTNLQFIRSLSLDYCRKLKCESTATIIQRLPKLLHLSISSCPILHRSESEWLHPLHSRKIKVELSHVSKVSVRLGY